MATADEIETELERANDHYKAILAQLAEAENAAEAVEAAEYLSRRDEGAPIEDSKLRAKYTATDERAVARILSAREKAGRSYIDQLTTVLMRRMGQEKREAKIV